MELVRLLLFSIVVVAAAASSDTLREESESEVALFQGYCSSPSSPCHQICIAKSSMTYECGCREGYQLSKQDGYSCRRGEETTTATTTTKLVQPSSWQQQQQQQQSPGNGDDDHGGCLSFQESSSWFSLPPLSDAYEEDEIELQFKPNKFGGLLLVSGERISDFVAAAGDYIAIIVDEEGRVEFRFDCGSGPALIRSQNRAVLNNWNQIKASRQRWDGGLTLNGVRVVGRSGGLFSRITFRERVYIGGVPLVTAAGIQSSPWQQQQQQTLVAPSFTGSIRRLRINTREYDLNTRGSADYEFGGLVQECGSHGNDDNNCTCLHGGQCSPPTGICDCPLGYQGANCETVLQMKTPSFNGSSYLLFKPVEQLIKTIGGHGNETLIESYLELKIVLKPTAHDGALLYSSSPSNDEDHIYIYMDGGHIVLELDLGSGAGRGRSERPLKLYSYHSLIISRTGRMVTMNVDSQPTVTLTTPGGYTQLTLGEIYLGGLGVEGEGVEKLGVRTGFSGCVQELTINSFQITPLISHASLGLNVGECADGCDAAPCLHGDCLPKLEDYICQCHAGWRGGDCGQVMENVGGNYKWTGESWANSEVILQNAPPTSLNLTLQLKTSHSEGLLFLWGRIGNDYIAIGLENGYLTSWMDLGGGEVQALYNKTRVDDGEWRGVAIERLEQHFSVSVDGGPRLEVRIPGKMADFSPAGRIWIGGHPNIPLATSNKYNTGFSGCLRDATLNGVEIQFSESSGLEYC